jgi:hypothetical protein
MPQSMWMAQLYINAICTRQRRASRSCNFILEERSSDTHCAGEYVGSRAGVENFREETNLTPLLGIDL